ncbi:MAG: helix-turn-helix transcriptional regulator [Bacteroidetes bacterium]|nr:helix-turn-helix transcriptional regulator [Bacteroidota bacterium]
MVDRILEMLKEKNLSPSQFADEIGIQRSGMSHLLSGRNKPSLEFIMKILKRYPDIKADWLLYGTSEAETEIETAPVQNVQKEVTLFDIPETVEPKPENRQPPKGQVQRKEKQEKKVEKIVIFYDDKTFREYEPER